jgi:serine/threonine protein kinase
MQLVTLTDDKCGRVIKFKYQNEGGRLVDFFGKESRIEDEERVLLAVRGIPYVIPCVGALKTTDINGGEHRFLVTPCGGQTLLEFMGRDPHGTLKLSHGSPNFRIALMLRKDQVRDIMMHLIFGLQHIHHAGVLHMDIKPENILVSLPT